MATTEKINGFEIVASYRTKEEDGTLPGRIIMGRKGEIIQTPHRKNYASNYKFFACVDKFVVAFLPDNESSWLHGWYSDNEGEATRDYWERINRGF